MSIYLKISLLFVFTTLSCVKTTEMLPDNDISKYEKQWQKQAIDDYSFTLKITCFCVYEYTLPKTVLVRNNAVVSVDGIAIEELNDTSHRTFDGFFKYIRERQSENPVVEKLKFDSKYGFPTYIYFDISEMIADEEIGYTITDFLPLK